MGQYRCVTVRFTPAEFAVLERGATARKLSAGSYIRVRYGLPPIPRIESRFQKTHRRLVAQALAELDAEEAKLCRRC